MRPCPGASPALGVPSQPLRPPAPTPVSPLASCRNPHGGSGCTTEPQRQRCPPAGRTRSVRCGLAPWLKQAPEQREHVGTAAPQPGPRVPGRAGATGWPLAPWHRVTPVVPPVPLLSLGEHHRSPPVPPSAALLAAQIRRQICELLRKLLPVCETPRNITPAPAPASAPGCPGWETALQCLS